MRLQLAIPPLLFVLVDAGRWPASADEARAQSAQKKPRISPDRVNALVPGEHRIELVAPPFAVLSRLARHNRFWKQGWSAPHDIDHAKAVLIGDFGMGSDLPIVLDYLESPDEPQVRYLRLGPLSEPPADFDPREFGSARYSTNEWGLLAPTFEDFVHALGI